MHTINLRAVIATNLAHPFFAPLGACLLAAAPAHAQATSPRAQLEAAHYAESVQRDYATAEAGYRATIEAARRAGDAKTIEEAQLALDALLARVGKASVKEQAAGQLPSGVVQLLSGDGDGAARGRDLALYGDLIVPFLAQCSRAPAGVAIPVVHRDGVHNHINDPLEAVSTLAMIKTPAADKALIEALGSNDPMVRKAVIRVVDSERIDVLLVAVKDPVEVLSSDATARALSGNDPRLADLARARALQGCEDGTNWLARNDWRAAWALAEQGAGRVDPVAVFRSISVARVVQSEGFPAFEAAVQLHLASTSPTVRRESARLLVQMLSYVTQKEAGSNSWVHGPELDARMHALARTSRLPLFVEALSGTNAVDRIVTASAYVRGGALDQEGLTNIQTRLLPPDMRAHPRESKSLVELATLVAARKDDPAELAMLERIGTLMQSRGRVGLDEAASLERVNEAIELALVLRTPAQRAALTSVALRAVEDRMELARGNLPPAGSVPKNALLLGEWLLQAGRHDEFAIAALNIYAACDTSAVKELLPRLCDLLQVGRARAERTGRLIVERAHAEDAAGTRALLGKRLEFAVDAATKGGDGALVLVANLSVLAQHLPNDEGVGIIRAAAAKASPECMARLVILPSDVAAGRREPTAGQLSMLVELLPRALAIDEGGGVSTALAIFQRTLHEPALPVIGAALRSSSLDVRTAAQAAMREFREQREALEEFDLWMQAARLESSTTTRLVEQLQSKDRSVVLGAVRALAAIKARTALPDLVKLLASDDAELTSAVESAIAAM